MARQYAYKPIGEDEIRVLILLPGTHDDILRGRLETVKLDSSDYYAISYTWGAPIFDNTLEFPQSELKITESLHGALRRFRSQTKDVRLWADAVCIDQTNVEERSAQVNVMAQIFSQAQKVLVWLGEQCGGDTTAFWMMGAKQRYFDKYGFIDTAQSAWDHFTRQFDASYSEKEQKCACCHTHRDLLPVYRGMSSFCASLSALVRLLERPYFGRMWVVQEITGIQETRQGGVDFYCGEHRSSGTALFRALALLDPLISYYDGPVGFAPTGPTRPVFATFELLSRVPDHLIYTLMATRDLQCSNPRDRLFAGRALADVEDVETLRPDYTISVDALWQRVATFLLTTPSPRVIEEGGIDASFVLAIIGTQDGGLRSRERSSWAPDFGRIKRASRDKQRFYEMECGNVYAPVRAGGTQIFRAQVCQADSMNLLVRGKHVSTISVILPDSRFQAANNDSATLPQYESYVRCYLIPWYINCYQFLAESGAADGWRTDFDMILQQGAVIGRQTSPPWETIGWMFEKACGHALPHTDSLDTRQMLEDLNAFLLERITHGYYLDQKRFLACSSDGSACWVPETALAGDAIFVLEGAPFPFVLRPRPDGRYTVLGDSYVHGIMAGEAWPSGSGDIQDVVLR